MQNNDAELGPIFDEIENGLLLLTPNHRTSVQVLESYGTYRKVKGLTPVCMSPNIYPVDIWIKQQWDILHEYSSSASCRLTVLNPVQEQNLWQDLICHSSNGASLLNPQATATKALIAYRNILQWQIPLHELQLYATSLILENSQNEDLDYFLSWLVEYENTLKKINAISFTALIPHLISSIDNEELSIPKKIVLLGFDNPPPLYLTLFSTIKSKNCQVINLNVQFHNPQVQYQSLTSKEQEVTNAAAWSKNIIKNNPKAKVAIICLDLHERAKEFNQAFHHCFRPEMILKPNSLSKITFSMTASESLGSLAVIELGFGLLALGTPSIPTLELCLLIRSPYIIGSEEESVARAKLEFQLRKRSELFCNIAQLRNLANQDEKPWHCPILVETLLKLENLKKQNKKSRSASQWCTFIENYLSIFNWFDQISTHEQKHQLQQWYELLNSFSELSLISGLLTYAEAVDKLCYLASSSPSSNFINHAPVQILTPTEAAGLSFSHLWFMGLSEQSWPQKSQVNPFIPFEIQNKYQLPGINPDLQYKSAKETLSQLILQTRQQVILSSPKQIDDVLLNPSRLLNTYFDSEYQYHDNQPLLENFFDWVHIHPYCLELFTINSAQESKLEQYREEQSIPFIEGEQALGGTALIADQSTCPFRNFALRRLNSKELPCPQYGLPAYELGNMLHVALELLWKKAQAQDDILSLSVSERTKLCNDVASTSVNLTAKYYPRLMTPQFTNLEAKRLSHLLLKWLDEELKRQPFKVIKHEYQLQWQYSSITLQFRIDRIEEYEDGSIGIVDYKSSLNNSINWLDDRPDKPQLLLYLQAAESDTNLTTVNSLLYAQVNIEDMKFRGLSNNDQQYPGIDLQSQKKLPPEITWEHLKHHWQISVQTIAQEFIDGYAAVKPKSSNSCQYCHLSSLCRINESTINESRHNL